MVTYEDCLALAGLTPEQVDRVAARERVPAIVALGLACHLARTVEDGRPVRPPAAAYRSEPRHDPGPAGRAVGGLTLPTAERRGCPWASPTGASSVAGRPGRRSWSARRGWATRRCAGRVACRGERPCTAWFWDDPALAPAAPPRPERPMSEAQADAVVAVYLADTDRLCRAGADERAA